ncbi:MAG: flavodoxin family protein [Campylobacter sp.]
MKRLVIYTTKTGNTAKVGNAIADELGCGAVNFSDVESLNLDEFDYIAIGFYVDKGDAETNFKNWLKSNIKNKKVGVFMTLGADPDNPHSVDCINKVKDVLRQNGNEILNEYFCQGAVSPEMIAIMRKMGEAMPNDPRFAITPEREERWLRAASHPDENDLQNAKKAFKIN